jgi:hypothetical protein
VGERALLSRTVSVQRDKKSFLTFAQDAVMALLVKADQMKITVQHDPLPAGFKVSWKLYIGALPPVL